MLIKIEISFFAEKEQVPYGKKIKVIIVYMSIVNTTFCTVESCP